MPRTVPARFVILAVCASVLGIASARVEAGAAGEAAAREALDDSAWAFAHWRTVAEAAASAFGLDSPTITMRYGYDGEDGQRSLFAYAEPGALTLRLGGSGWRGRTARAEALLARNAGHEAAHLYQYALGPAGDAPRWLHEGFAEAMGLEAVAKLDAVPDGQAARYAAHRQRVCLDGIGSIRERQARGDEAAVYDCGHAVVAAAALARGEDARALYDAFARTDLSEDAFLALVAEAPAMRRSVTRFLSLDWSHADPDWVLRQLRAGRL